MKHKLLIDDEHKTFIFKGRESSNSYVWILDKTIDGVVPSETKFYKFLESLYEDYFSKGYQLLIDERWEGHCWDFTLTIALHKKILFLIYWLNSKISIVYHMIFLKY